MTEMEESKPIIPLGTKTKFGKVAAVGMKEGERFYMFIDRIGVTLIPAEIAEMEHAARSEEA